MMTSVGSRRWSGHWARPEKHDEPSLVDVLIPTSGRGAELAVTLAGLAAQDDPPFSVTISDQSDTGNAGRNPSIRAMLRVLQAQGRPARVLRHVPPRGMAEQRQFLLDASTAAYVLFLDDDVWLEPGTLQRMASAIEQLGCGFVGSAVQGLSYLDEDRPDELREFSPWTEPVHPERIRRDAPEFERWRLHNAANLAHQAARLQLSVGAWLPYRIAWVGGCVLYRREALVECGGFDFWPDLPVQHAGEDVAAQWRVMERFGGVGLVPSGAVHLEAPTTIEDRSTDATDIVFGASDEGTTARDKVRHHGN
jgi:GT2 family glycosyltransferase